jgi:hypothetical protein
MSLFFELSSSYIDYVVLCAGESSAEENIEPILKQCDLTD